MNIKLKAVKTLVFSILILLTSIIFTCFSYAFDDNVRYAQNYLIDVYFEDDTISSDFSHCIIKDGSTYCDIAYFVKKFGGSFRYQNNDDKSLISVYPDDTESYNSFKKNKNIDTIWVEIPAVKSEPYGYSYYKFFKLQNGDLYKADFGYEYNYYIQLSSAAKAFNLELLWDTGPNYKVVYITRHADTSRKLRKGDTITISMPKGPFYAINHWIVKTSNENIITLTNPGGTVSGDYYNFVFKVNNENNESFYGEQNLNISFVKGYYDINSESFVTTTVHQYNYCIGDIL